MSESIISKELSDAIDPLLEKAGAVPCYESPTDSRNSCITKAERDRNGKRLGWHQYDVRKMCAGCACYWHLSCARNFTLGVVR